MAPEASQNTLPDNVIRAVVTDTRRLLSLTVDQRAALIKALQGFVPSTTSIDQAEAEELGAPIGVDAADVESAMRLGYFLRGRNNRPSEFSDDAVLAALQRACAEAQLTGADTLLRELSIAAAAMAKRFARNTKLERAMPSLVDSVIACDLRYLPGEKTGEFDLAPMAIVRLQFDGADDAIFHCSPQSLERFIKKLQDAVATLDVLEKIAQQKS